MHTSYIVRSAASCCIFFSRRLASMAPSSVTCKYSSSSSAYSGSHAVARTMQLLSQDWRLPVWAKSSPPVPGAYGLDLLTADSLTASDLIGNSSLHFQPQSSVFGTHCFPVLFILTLCRNLPLFL
ncbi:hypothetical protein AHF37_11706 [Paragonimus kellicotti]|nr:hypothetical protein AHF37_11706 [Paragonimus kellicotti]